MCMPNILCCVSVCRRACCGSVLVVPNRRCLLLALYIYSLARCGDTNQLDQSSHGLSLWINRVDRSDRSQFRSMVSVSRKMSLSRVQGTLDPRSAVAEVTITHSESRNFLSRTVGSRKQDNRYMCIALPGDDASEL